ncbi:MAG: stage V sporulation protein SpoVM [Candidatus Syntrophonatronum acetioxidans]|uniref:Stage V sporulation protein SpoVM n=1 Tax=Candidatus Syntrophonatronum acetioxidans TaxID=1795816 RepID=A0A424YHS8_9FIRM|nr:MAG: stage V sporulation protein SpoVM [Candidatus Syntrophonatronum acetioxidans]
MKFYTFKLPKILGNMLKSILGVLCK